MHFIIHIIHRMFVCGSAVKSWSLSAQYCRRRRERKGWAEQRRERWLSALLPTARWHCEVTFYLRCQEDTVIRAAVTQLTARFMDLISGTSHCVSTCFPETCRRVVQQPMHQSSCNNTTWSSSAGPIYVICAAIGIYRKWWEQFSIILGWIAQLFSQSGGKENI